MKEAAELLAALTAIGWTQRAIAKELGTTPMTVRCWARGKRKPRLDAYRKIWTLYQEMQKEFKIKGEG